MIAPDKSETLRDRLEAAYLQAAQDEHGDPWADVVAEVVDALLSDGVADAVAKSVILGYDFWTRDSLGKVQVILRAAVAETRAYPPATAEENARARAEGQTIAVSEPQHSSPGDAEPG